MAVESSTPKKSADVATEKIKSDVNRELVRGDCCVIDGEGDTVIVGVDEISSECGTVLKMSLVDTTSNKFTVDRETSCVSRTIVA